MTWKRFFQSIPRRAACAEAQDESGTERQKLKMMCLESVLNPCPKVDGKPVALALWTLFGTTNQLLAGLTLLVATLYLRQRRHNFWATGLSMVGVLASTLYAMINNLVGFLDPSSPTHSDLLAAVGGLLLVLALWLCLEAILVIRRDDVRADWELELGSN